MLTRSAAINQETGESWPGDNNNNNNKYYIRRKGNAIQATQAALYIERLYEMGSQILTQVIIDDKVMPRGK
jgi:hypothetical protein